MKVWIVNPFDNLPLEGYRPQRYWLMGKAFARNGDTVTYWTGDFSHAHKRKRALCAPNEDALNVNLLPVRPYARNVCLSRIKSHLALAREWTRRAEAAAEKPDLVIASMPPLSLCEAARQYAARNKAFFIADIQDAWPETFARVVPHAVLSLLGLRKKAKTIYTKADGISAVADRYLQLARSYGACAPSAIFGHCIERPPLPAMRAAQDGPLRLVYIGNMSLSYDLDTLLEAVAGESDISLDLAGNGPDRTRLEKKAASLGEGAANIRFHPYLDGHALAALLRACDVGVVPMFPESCVGIPGKLADYAAAGLKVIECLGGETATCIDAFGAGAHYTPKDVPSLKRAIARVRALPASRQRDAFARRFDAVSVMDRYVAWACALVRDQSAR